MFPRQQFFHTFPLLAMISVLFLSACRLLSQPVSVEGTAPTPVVSIVKETAPTPVVVVETGGVDNPDVFVDPAAFRVALVQAIAARDTEKLQMWMTEPFLEGGWRADLSDTPPQDALKWLYTEHLGQDIHLAVVEGADLKALMGGIDPLSIPRAEAGVVDAFLVSGWGMEGNDEAILFVARQPDNSLKWHGWMQIQGGFSGVKYGGAQAYQNEALGFSLYAPKGFDVSAPTADEVVILAPGEGHPGEGRAAAFIMVEPANGRTADQVVEAVRTELGPGFNVSIYEILGIDDAQAFVVSGLPGQDSNRQLFMVHNDLLYNITFIPDLPQAGDAYRQMLDIYAMVVNTFHFTK